ncbi:hypothetical protein JGK46_002288 [Aeromonas bestiarum]|nr:hypothetical protein [Aeromonas bestiarum]
MKADFDYLSSLISEFFSQKEIQNRLNIIYEHDISGWETWLQIEFSTFLAGHASEPDWGREVALSVDKRKEKDRLAIRPDFIIRKKGWRQERYMALEMKIHPAAKSCIHNMMADFEKLGKMKASELDVRSYWGLGLFLTPGPDSEPLDEIIDNKALEWGVECPSATTAICAVEETHYSYAIL